MLLRHAYTRCQSYTANNQPGVFPTSANTSRRQVKRMAYRYHEAVIDDSAASPPPPVALNVEQHYW